MNPDEEALAIAARIADGSGIDWKAANASLADGSNLGVLNQLKAIASLADLHREWAGAPLGDVTTATTQWGPLTVLGPIGEGQFGRVYRAWDPRLQRQVALKLLHTTSPELTAAPTRAIEEARMLAQVRHPNVLTVHGAESINGQVGIWTEFIDGRTLESLIAGRDPLPAEDVIAIGIDLCRALAAVHDAGLLHRDVKAQNVMRETGGRIVLMDFGTGHDVERAPAREGDLSGTPLYLAPELFDGGLPSVASDVYALAVLLFYLSTGTYPVPGRTLDEVRTGHGARRPVHMGDIRSDVPTELAAVIERGLATTLSARYASAHEFEAALERVRSAPIAAPPSTATAWAPRRIAAVAAVSLAAATVVAVGWIFNIGGWATRPPGGDSSLAGVFPQDAGRVHKVTIPPRKMMAEYTMGPPSRDGQFFPYVTPTDDVAVWNVRTGKYWPVTGAGQSGGFGRAPVMSPTGDRVAFTWTHADGAHELLMRNADGTWPQTLIPRKTAYEPIPVDWSRDGEQILCWLLQKDGTFDLALVKTGGGTPRVVYTDVAQRTVQLSPDARFVIMRRPKGSATPLRSDLVIIETAPNAAEPRVILEGQANERHPSWTPDGTHIFFVRDSSSKKNSSDGFLMPVVDGLAAGDAVLVAEDLGALSAEVLPDVPVSWSTPVGVTDDGSLYQLVAIVHNDVYNASIELAPGSFVTGAPTRVLSQALGDKQSPSWSPDGRFIAYLAVPENFVAGSEEGRTLTLYETSTGQAKEIPVRLTLRGWAPQWSPDSSTVTLWATDTDQQPSGSLGYFRVNIYTAKTDRVMVDGQSLSQYFQYSPDGKEFFYRDQSLGIVARTLAGGKERVIVAQKPRSSVEVFALSPDGQSIAFRRARDCDRGSCVNELLVQPIGGPPRVLANTQKEILRTVGWTPDSQDVLYSKGPTGAKPLWRIAAAGGGEARDTGFEINSPINSISFSPDGRRIVYPERVQVSELWIGPSVLGPRQAGSVRPKR